MAAIDFEVLLNFFKALGNEKRLKLIGILAQTECSVEDLAARLQLKEPTVSHHLNKLKELDLVTMRSQGNIHLYKLSVDTLANLNQSLLDPQQITSWTQDIPTDAWEQKVLQNYLNGDRLKEIPASRKKRLVILQWLVDKFDLEKTYTEPEVNQILSQYYDDYATLRREFIGYQLMKRDRGIYQRLASDSWQNETEIAEKIPTIPKRYPR